MPDDGVQNETDIAPIARRAGGPLSRAVGIVALVAALVALFLYQTMPERPLVAGAALGFGFAAALAVYGLRRFEGQLAELRDERDAAHRASADAVEASRRRERETGEKAARLALALDELPVGVFATDASGGLIYANRTLGRWVDRPAAAMIGARTSLSALCESDTPPPEHGVAMVKLRSAGGEGISAYVMRNAASDGAGTRGVILRDPGGATDEQDTTAAADVAAAAPPDWLFRDSPVGIALLGDDGTIADCNAALCRFLGRSRDGIVGSVFADQIALEDRDDLAASLSKLVLGTARAVHVEVRLPTAGAGSDGLERAASVYASKAPSGSDGDDDRIVLHVIDETEHRHLEVQFAQSQKMQAIGQLAGGVAHDFNNLLTAMIGFCDLLLQRHGPEDPSFADIMQIQQNANRATNLVRQLLAFSRKQTLAPVVIDPAEALGDLSHLLGRLLGETVELELKPEPDVHLIRADRGQFDQVIINLAVNARDAMPGGGTLSVAARNETVASSVRRGDQVMPPGAYVVVEVADTGTGISKENIERIFEPFFSTKEVGAGTGLGLSTVYGIVRQSEGFIFVESAVGHGTTFRIYLPAFGGDDAVKGVLASDAAAAAGRALEERRKEQQAKSGEDEAADLTGAGVVLLVEDEDAVRQFGARALRNKGYTVYEAENGEAALDVINGIDENIDLIVSDVVMPGMDGHTLVQLVRQELNGVKVILMSGYAEDVFRDEISRDPSIHFLSKPFSLKTLASTVKGVMEGGAER
ncbi:MAG: response regulator [Rhodospirillales bacterium]